MKPIYSIVLQSFLIFISSCSHPSSPTETPVENPEVKSKYFPLTVGNIWYYSYYNSMQEADTTKYNEQWETFAKKPLGSKQFYCIKRTYWIADTIFYLDTIYYCIDRDSLLQILPNSSICVRAIFPDTGITALHVRWETDNESIEGYISNRTDSTITYQFWRPGWTDSDWQETYKKDVGLFDTRSGWGLGSRLIRFHFVK